MGTPATAPGSIDEYIAGFPTDVQDVLRQIRATIREVIPEATEKVSYGVPTFALHRNVVHFGGFAKHVSVYPAPRGNERFREVLSRYRGGKGTVQFPLGEPLPLELIRDIVRFLVEQDEAAAARRTGRGRRTAPERPEG
ncbi:MAG TPA: DUF1801 domain-containing protein [Longimicrobiaceae bacterium]